MSKWMTVVLAGWLMLVMPFQGVAVTRILSCPEKYILHQTDAVSPTVDHSYVQTQANFFQPEKLKEGSCSACAECCLGIAVIVNIRLLDSVPAITSSERIAFAQKWFADHIPKRQKPPPRPVIA